MTRDFQILAYEETDLGPLCLRRRRTLREPRTWVTEVTLNHEFLMSSFHTDSERALATLAIERVTGEGLRVLVGGLGLGYTAATALESPRVGKVEIIEFLPPVIEWMKDGLIPLSAVLSSDQRLEVIQGDVYARLLSEPTEPTERRWDAILVDVDHSPGDQLSDRDYGFYSRCGLVSAVKHLNAGGILALWSYEGNQVLEDAMRDVCQSVEVLPVTYTNHHVDESFTDWLFLGKVASELKIRAFPGGGNS